MKLTPYTRKFNEGFKAFQNIYDGLKLIVNTLKDKKISFCIIGGLAVNQYANPRMTEDIDLLIDSSDKEKFDSLIGTYLKKAFTGAKRSFFWNNPKIKIDIIYSGEKAGSNKGISYEDPNQISKSIKSIPFITIKEIIKYKLSSGLYGKSRLQDFADVQHIIKINKLPKDFADYFRDDLREKYIEIWNETI